MGGADRRHCVTGNGNGAARAGREDRRIGTLVARLACCATSGGSGLIFGGVGPLYFGSNAFLPGYLNEAGRTDLISPALTALNLGQLPASLLLIGFARHIESRAWPFVLASASWSRRRGRHRHDGEHCYRGERGLTRVRRRRRLCAWSHAAANFEHVRARSHACRRRCSPSATRGTVAVSLLCGAAWDIYRVRRDLHSCRSRLRCCRQYCSRRRSSSGAAR